MGLLLTGDERFPMIYAERVGLAELGFLLNFDESTISLALTGGTLENERWEGYLGGDGIKVVCSDRGVGIFCKLILHPPYNIE